MQYRRFGKTGEMVSVLGLGMMRLPLLNGEQGAANVGGHIIDEAAVTEMVRWSIDHGLNYIDTAYSYMDGNSEVVTGKALKDGYREKTFIATKAPVWLFEKEDDFDRILDEQLTRLQTDYIDFYMLHSLDKAKWQKHVLDVKAHEHLLAAKKAGKVRHIGFSFHDDLDTFKMMVDFWDEWEFCQIQLNYLDTAFQAGLEGLAYAAAKDLGVVIMEPLRGGYLTKVPTEIEAIFRSIDKTPVEAALDFLWDLPQVSLLLSGMKNKEQAEENIGYAADSAPGMLTEAQKKAIQDAKDNFMKYAIIPCTGCNYCNVCPQGVNIPQNITVYNEYQTTNKLSRAKNAYAMNVPMFGAQAKDCVGCGLCEESCPQHIKISEWMPKIHEMFK